MEDLTAKRNRIEAQIAKNKTMIKSHEESLRMKRPDRTQDDDYYTKQIEHLKTENELMQAYIDSEQYIKDAIGIKADEQDAPRRGFFNRS